MIFSQSSSEWPHTGCSAVVPAALTKMSAGPQTCCRLREKSLDDVRVPNIEMAGEYPTARPSERLAYFRDLGRVGIRGGIGGTAGDLIDIGTDGNIGAFACQGVGDSEALPGQAAGDDGAASAQCCPFDFPKLATTVSPTSRDRSLRDRARNHARSGNRARPPRPRAACRTKGR